MKIRGSVLSSSFTFAHPPEVINKSSKRKTGKSAVRSWYTYHKGSLRDGVDVISRGRHKSIRGNTGVLTMLSATVLLCCCRVLRITGTGMRSDDVCVIVDALNMKMSSFDLLVLTVHNPNHTASGSTATARSTAGDVPLPCCCGVVCILLYLVLQQ